jgi:hypothetical protein
LWTAEGIGRRPQRDDPERTDVREETLKRPALQQWYMGPRFRGEATSWKREDNQWDLQEEHRAEDREASSKDFKRNAENRKSNLVEWSAPSETEEEPRSTTSNATVSGKEENFG